MKKFVLLLTVLIMVAANAVAARMTPADGRVVDEKGEAVGFATVVLLRNNEQVTGLTTDADGRFELKVPAGEYTLMIQFLGYDPIRQQVRIDENSKLGDYVLKTSTTEIEGVVVKAQLVRREADRFIVDVANTPAAMGKDGIELLENAPGVWIDGEKITINGKSGSKVMVNDRELRMEPEQLLTYLKTLRAEEIQKIEVVPVTGADFDADSSGGMIKITLRKRRENGLDGSLSMRTNQSSFTSNYSPSGNINIHSGRVDLFASAWGYFGSQDGVSDEHTKYSTQQAALTSHSEITDQNRNYGFSAGTVVEINPRHSVGAELNFWRNKSYGPTDSYTDFVTEEATTRTDSRYGNSALNKNYTGTFNYIWKIDSLGSTLKLLADYTQREGDTRNDNFSRITSPASTVDSTYRNDAATTYRITTATLAYDKKFSPRWSLRAGAKYTYNDMRNDALYEYLKNDAWVRNDAQSFTINYTENIAAAYGIVSANLGRWSAVAGLRGEYTHTNGKYSDVGQDYFSLFPNANVSYALSKDGAYTLIAQYARTIERPRFWCLNPQRSQISDYTYQTGNPELDPSFKQDVSLTAVLKHKYTFTAGVVLQKDEINQTIVADSENPDMLKIAWVNYDATKKYYFSTNLPFQFTKWWQMNANATYMYYSQRLDQHAPEQFQHVFFMNLSTTFTLPAKFYIDLSYNYQGRVVLGNVWVEPQQRVTAGIKKRFGERFVASFTARNLLNERQKVGAKGDGFVRKMEVIQEWNSRFYQIGLTYNFKSGKAFKRKAVEAGSAEEKSRL